MGRRQLKKKGGSPFYLSTIYSRVTIEKTPIRSYLISTTECHSNTHRNHD